MDQLAIKGKKCKSEVCLICENSAAAPECDAAGSDDFIDCEKCGLPIHKICFKLSGDLLKIFQDFERRNEKFPFTILCPGCRQLMNKKINEVQQVVDSCEEGDNSKNPFEIDCIVQVIVDHLNVQDLANVRLVNKLWNENASRILSKESRQDQLKAYDPEENDQDLEDCLQIVKSSDQKKLMQKWTFQLDTPEEFKVLNQILTITRPINVVLCQYETLELKENTLFSTLLTNISENVVDLSLDFQEITGLEPSQFCMPKFIKLKSLMISCLLHKNYEFLKSVIENSPKLTNLTICNCDPEDLTFDNYITEESQYCILNERAAQNLQKLKILGTCFNFETFFLQMKLKTLSLHADYPQYLKFGKLKSFLTSLSDTLETLKLFFSIDELGLLDEIEDLATGQLNLPRLHKVEHFSLEFCFDEYDKVFEPDEEIWPVKPIILAGQLPNLKKISITHCPSWSCSFETEQKCPGVTKLVLNRWADGDLAKLVELFPKVEILKLTNFCPSIDKNEKIYTQLDNLNGWSESLKRIEISCGYYHLENFDFEKLGCLSNLESIKISNEYKYSPNHFIYPDFTPLFKIATLTQVVINKFKISKGIVEDLREKYPSLDYSFYPS